MNFFIHEMDVTDYGECVTQSKLLEHPGFRVGVEVGLSKEFIRVSLYPTLVGCVENPAWDGGGDGELIHCFCIGE